MLSNEYQHDRVKMVFKNLCVLVLWTKVPSALEGLSCCYMERSTVSHLVSGNAMNNLEVQNPLGAKVAFYLR